MKTRTSRQIQFNKLDKVHVDKTVDLLVDICNVMLDAVDVGEEYDTITDINMVDADTGEIIAIRSEFENCAMMLANLWTYIEENINENINVECHEIGKIKVDSMF